MSPVAVAILVGAFVLAVGVAAGIRIGLALLDRLAIQLRVTNRELLQMVAGFKRQVAATRDAVSRLITDPRTAIQDKIALEEHVAPLLVERGQGSGSQLALPAPSWWRRAGAWLVGPFRRRR